MLPRNSEVRGSIVWNLHVPCFVILRCYSDFIGRKDGGVKQEISIIPACDKFGTIVHELLHAFGFEHEHVRPDREKFITWYKNNTKSSKSLLNISYNLANGAMWWIPYYLSGFKVPTNGFGLCVIINQFQLCGISFILSVIKQVIKGNV